MNQLVQEVLQIYILSRVLDYCKNRFSLKGVLVNLVCVSIPGIQTPSREKADLGPDPEPLGFTNFRTMNDT